MPRLITAVIGSSMNGLDAYVRRSLDIYSLMDLDPLPPFVHRHFKRVYFSLFFGTLCIIAGVCMQFFGEIEGGHAMRLGLVVSGCFLYETNPVAWSKWIRGSFLMAGAFFFGACVLPGIQFVFNMDPRFFIAFLAGRALCFGCFWVGALRTRVRFRLYYDGFFYSCLLLLAWFFIASSFLDHRFLLLMEFINLEFFPVHLLAYSQEMAVTVRAGEEVDFVKSTIRFFTDFSVVTIYSFFVMLRVGQQEGMSAIKGILHTRIACIHQIKTILQIDRSVNWQA